MQKYCQIFLANLVLIVLLVLQAPVVHAAATAYHFDFNDRCHAAYKAMVSLRITEANQLIRDELQEDPYNLIPVLIANYDDCLTLLFNGDPREYKRRKGNLAERIKLIEKGDPASPWYRYALGSLSFQWAAVRIRFNEYFGAATEFRKSFIYLKENQKKFPEFKYNQVLLGLEEAIIGTIPDNYRWVGNVLGLRGDVRKGTAKIVDFLNTKGTDASVLREEAIFYYCYLKYFLLSDPEGVWKFLNNSDLDFRNNHLFAFMKANLALDNHKAGIAEQTVRNRNASAGYLDVPIFNYQLGVALLQKMDKECLNYFQKFQNHYRGNLFVKDAYQKMSFYCLAIGNLPQAFHYKSKIAQAGTAQIDADKQAQRYGQNNIFPNPLLLKARLLSDGGYFSKALEQLKHTRAADFPEIGDQLEYHYRYARIYTLMEQPGKAIPFYEITIKKGALRPEHFAARSALELGQIYEEQGEVSKAVANYRKCLSMKNHDYKSSLDQKAKAGINRLGGTL